MAKNEQNAVRHTIILEDRARMTLSGVSEVRGFSDTSVSLKTGMGELIIKGKALSIGKLNTETGELYISGEFSAITYTKSKSSGGVFEGLFK